MQNTNSLSSLSALRKLEVPITAQQLNKQHYKDWTQTTKWTKFWRAGWKEKWDSEHYHVIITVRAPETQFSHHSESKEAKKTLEIKDRQRKSKKKSGEPEEKNQNSEHWAPKEQPTLKRLNTSNKRVPENQFSHHSASRNKTYKTKDRQRKSEKYGEQEGRKKFRTLSRYLHYELITLKRRNTQLE